MASLLSGEPCAQTIRQGNLLISCSFHLTLVPDPRQCRPGAVGGSRREGDGRLTRRSGRPGSAVCIPEAPVRALDGDPDEPGGASDAVKSTQADPGPPQIGASLHQAAPGSAQADPGSTQAASGNAQAGGGLHQAGPDDAPAGPGNAPAGLNPAQAGEKRPSIGRKRRPGGAGGRGCDLESFRIGRNRAPDGRERVCGDGGETWAGLDGSSARRAAGTSPAGG